MKQKHPCSRGSGMSTQTRKNKRFTFDRRKLTIDPVPTILYYKDTDTNIHDATVKLNYDPSLYYKKDVVSDNKLIPLSVTDWSWDGCSFVLEINLKK